MSEQSRGLTGLNILVPDFPHIPVYVAGPSLARSEPPDQSEAVFLLEPPMRPRLDRSM